MLVAKPVPNSSIGTKSNAQSQSAAGALAQAGQVPTVETMCFRLSSGLGFSTRGEARQVIWQGAVWSCSADLRVNTCQVKKFGASSVFLCGDHMLPK